MDGVDGETQLGVSRPTALRVVDVAAGRDVLRQADQVLGLTEHQGVVTVLHLDDYLGLVGVVVSLSAGKIFLFKLFLNCPHEII